MALPSSNKKPVLCCSFTQPHQFLSVKDRTDKKQQKKEKEKEEEKKEKVKVRIYGAFHFSKFGDFCGAMKMKIMMMMIKSAKRSVG
jgi:hypothetical protein